MQNIDFSRTREQFTPEFEPPPDFSQENGGAAIKKSNRLLVGAVVFGLLSFSGGMIAGIRVGHYQKIDNAILQKVSQEHPITTKAPATTALAHERVSDHSSPAPRIAPKSTTTVANAAPKKSSAKYVIILGNFAPANAEKLLLQVSAIGGLAAIKPQPCAMVDESVPDRGPGFRLEHPTHSNLHRVYVGCFNRLGVARQAYNLLDKSGILKITDARLIEIE